MIDHQSMLIILTNNMRSLSTITINHHQLSLQTYHPIRHHISVLLCCDSLEGIVPPKFLCNGTLLLLVPQICSNDPLRLSSLTVPC